MFTETSHLHPVLANEGCLFIWNYCNNIELSFGLPNLVKYPFILHTAYYIFVEGFFDLYC